MIQKDGLNFVRLYFLNYTRYVNDLHDIWKRRYKIFKYHRWSARLAHSRAAASVESKIATMQPRLTFSSDIRGRPELLPLHPDSLFAQISDSNDKYSSSLEVECWNEGETHAAQQSPTQF